MITQSKFRSTCCKAEVMFEPVPIMKEEMRKTYKHHYDLVYAKGHLHKFVRLPEEWCFCCLCKNPTKPKLI